MQMHVSYNLRSNKGPRGALISDLYITGSGYLLDLQACQHGLVDPAKRKTRASVSARAEGSTKLLQGKGP